MHYHIENNRIDIDTENTYTTIRDFLNDYRQSRRNQYLLLQNHQILLDNKSVNNADTAIEGKILTLVLPEEEIDWKSAEETCTCIYEDPFCYIVHKDPGIIIHSEHKDDIHCLNAYAARYQLQHHIHAPVRPIHRLDKDTTGLVFYSKIPFFQPWFDQMLAEKKIARQYLAICYGNIKEGKRFSSHMRIGRDRHQSGKYRISSTGKEAFTEFTCLKRKGPYVLIQCILHTGHTHQIRLHLSDMHLPIVNDPLYGKPSRDFRNMGLWAEKLSFHDPITYQKHTVHDLNNTDYDCFR